ncbi:epidermal growth factor-like protein 6 [Bombina bombina]|uniref:epidermal growth factor-like protein 6 n=1 Tax=Bombina bombina TaxID=8345 RepID=UPI00235AACE7|nr:epidermal growth factor-like protein 6 [Bombina bombina]
MLLLWITVLGAFLSCAAGRYPDILSSRHPRHLITSPNAPGLCRYGSKTDCCYGWKRNSKGQCEAVCEQGCKHGECLGANKCKCFPGFTGKSCSHDLNECGLKPRPCEHRCMNTHGSYKCYCLNGYMLMPDGSCSNSRTCAMANCQYGCEEVKGEVRCLCPSSGLQLGPDGRNCIDIDECAANKATCPFNRRCMNTFGSYYCKCQFGFELKYVNGKYDCIDINECLMNTHKCSIHSDCINTQGSYKCRCKQGYKGSGYDCAAITEKIVKESPKIVGRAKDTIKKLLAHKNSLKRNEQLKNIIPETVLTPSPKTRLQPFDYEDGIYIGGNYNEEDENEDFVEEDDEDQDDDDDDDDEEEDIFENLINQEKMLRGDVFAPQVKKEAAFGPLSVNRNVPQLKSEEVSIDCSFDQGKCNWKQDTEDDLDWKHVDRTNGVGYYMAVPVNAGQKKDIGRLQLALTNLRPNIKLCLLFNYRLFGERVGRLRVYTDKTKIPLWEENRSKNEGWRTASIEIPSNSNVSSIIFESERGKGKSGEMGLDNVFLVSGPCPED